VGVTVALERWRTTVYYMPEPGIVPCGTPLCPGSFRTSNRPVTSRSIERAPVATPAAQPRLGRLARPAPAAALALQLWLTSMLCWWVIGITFSRLWWLVNATQLNWILFCYAWQVPVIGWTGAVALPYLSFRRLQRRLEAGDPHIAPDLARFPLKVAVMVIATSSVGYLLGALQIDHFAFLPPLEFAKITIQGPVLGGFFAVAAYLMAERAVQRLGLPRSPTAAPQIRLVQPLYAKLLSMIVVVALGVAVPVFLYGLTQWQLLRETTRAEAMLAALDGVSSTLELDGPLSGFGPHTQGLIVRRSNNYIIWGVGRGRVLYGDGRRDFEPIQRFDRGWFASRDGEHKVVAYVYRPGVLPDGDGAVLVAISPFTDYGAELIAAAKPAAFVAGGALAIALALAAMLARSIVTPIERLRAAAVQIAAGELDVEPVALVRGDEVADLARAFDRMAARVRADEADLRTAYERVKRAQEQLVQHERLSAVGRLVSGVAHELNNPLTAVLHLAEDLQHGAGVTPGDREALQLIGNQARRCRSIVHDLLSFARGGDRRPERTGLSDLIISARRGVEPILRSMNVRLDATMDPADELEVDRLGLEQVLTNLIVNGAQAAGSGGWVRIEGTSDGHGWRITVEDSGTGIPGDVLPRIFEPFYTTRGEGEGTGLGLSVSLGIVERHGGTLQAESGGAGRGARFTVTLPGSGADAPFPDRPGAALAGHPNGNGAAGRPVALIVDDERSVRMALGRYFERCGWTVVEAINGAQALELLAPAEVRYDLVITDLRMPGKTGLDVHDWLSANRPALFKRLIIATGDVASPQIRAFIQRTPRPVLEKPFELSTLAALVERVTGES
jgi:signal transduction histidine kinase